jgi:hypothetical protein
MGAIQLEGYLTSRYGFVIINKAGEVTETGNGARTWI